MLLEYLLERTKHGLSSPLKNKIENKAHKLNDLNNGQGSFKQIFESHHRMSKTTYLTTMLSFYSDIIEQKN